MLSVKIAKLFEEHVYVFFCQMPKTKARSGAFQKGAIRQAHGPEQSRRTDVRSNRRQRHIALHHFETAHYCEFIGHYKKRHTHAPFMNPKMGSMSEEKDFFTRLSLFNVIKKFTMIKSP